MSEAHTVTLTSGVVVRIKPISLRLLQQFDLTHKQPKPPLVKSTATIGGAEEMVEDPDDPAYKQQLSEFTDKSTDDFMYLMTSFGTDVALPEDTSWIKRLERLGIIIDPVDLPGSYLQYVLMEDFTEDLRLLTMGIMRISGVSEEAISSWMETFPSKVG